jgi:hypothetical protein
MPFRDDPARVRAFADFVDVLANGGSDPERWEEYLVKFYGDPAIQEIRRKVVEMMLGTLSATTAGSIPGPRSCESVRVICKRKKPGHAQQSR